MQTTGDRADIPSGTAVSGRSTADSSGINGPFTEYDVLMRERDALVYHRQMLKRKRTELELSLKKQRNEKEVSPVLCVLPSTEALSRAAQSDQVPRTLSTHRMTFHPAPMLCRLELDVPVLTESMFQYISAWEAAGQLEYLAIRLRRVTPALNLFCSTQSLRSLDLNHTTITNEDLKGLQGCPNLVKMDLSYCDGVTEVSHILHMKVLEVVKLTGCYQLVDVGALGKLPRLKELDLSNTPVTNKELRLLSKCHTLEKIVLCSCKALKSVNPLSSIVTLEVIDLSYCTSLTHVGALGKLPVLREVNLGGSPITDEDVCLLSKCHTLVKIDLRSCKTLKNVDPLSSIATLEVINLSDCTSLTHVGALGKLPVLREVNLGETPITDEDVRLLSKCRTLVSIDLRRCHGLTNVNPLSSIATLEVINLSSCTALTSVGALGRLPALKDINLFGTRITDGEILQLSKSRTLVKIDISAWGGPINVSPLSSIATLEVLSLLNCIYPTYKGALGKFPDLKEVCLGKTPIADEEICLLSQSRTLVKIDLAECHKLTTVNPLSSIATLEEIDLSYCTSLTHVGALGKLPVLKEINLSYTRITDEEVRLLSQSQSLVKIDLNHCYKLSYVIPLSFIATLEVINLSSCNRLWGLYALGKLPMLMSLNLRRTIVGAAELDSLTFLRQQMGFPCVNIRR